MWKDVPEAFQDLLEIAAYVYTADQAVRRGSNDVDSFGHNWRRELHFLIPVRNPDFWSGAEVQNCLCSTLGFLSDDSYHFDFMKLRSAPPFQGYLDLNADGELFGYPEQVVMFSGGLDSLAGAIDEVLNEKRKIVLVTHKPTPKLNKRHIRLKNMLAAKSGENAPLHIGVRINKNKALNNEYTQRSRSFLYMAIGATIARMLNLTSLRFYENSVISLNLPICAQVAGGRATRTTHPKVLRGYQELVSLVAGAPFAVENPYIWKTKADVVEVITRAGCQDMIEASTSCAHTWEMTNNHTHCGTCSQCIDRRFAMIAANVEQHDPVAFYKADIFTQSRSKDEDKILVASFLERANQVHEQDDISQFIARYGEVSRAFRHMDGNPANVAQKTFDLYKRHAKEVCDAMDTLVARNTAAIRQRTLPGDCLLRTVYESGSVLSVPAIPVAVEQPQNFFRRRGGVWTARFMGNAEILLSGVDKGAEYINVLLARPNEKISVYEIACGSAISSCDSVLDSQELENGFLVTEGIPLGNTGAVADRKALGQYREKAHSLLQEIDEAREADNSVEVSRLEKEIAAITSAINEATGLGGRLRTSGDKRKNVRDAFRNAVKRAIAHIEKYDTPLATHLDECITLGNEAAYTTKENIAWEVRHITNLT